MSQFTAAYSFGVIVSCFSMLVAATLAQTWGGIGAPGIPGFGVPGFPGIPGFGAPGIPGFPGIGAPGIPDIGAPGIPEIPVIGAPGMPGIGAPGIPGFGAPGVPGKGCWDNLRGIRGCVEEVAASRRSGQIKISPQCCEAFMAIADTCWPKMFPFNPFFPPQIKNYCMKQGQLSPLPSPPLPASY